MKIKRFDTLSEEARKIRDDVFVKEQGFHHEFDDLDEMSTHLVLYDSGRPVAACRFYESEPDGVYIVGRLAVVKSYRGKHAGSQMLNHAEAEIRKAGGKKICLHAQVQAKEFYEKHGYAAHGGTDYDEHCPHVQMEKELA